MKKLKVFVVGGSIGYANWLVGSGNEFEGSLVRNIEQADLVLLTGGQDVHPSFYDEPVGKSYGTDPATSSSLTRDQIELLVIQEAIDLGKPMFGTCRGLQLLNVRAGGKMVQHLQHPGSHEITFYDGTTVHTNSIHHQLVYPFHLAKEEYHVVANSLGLSSFHLDGRNQQMDFPQKDGIRLEPECVFYPSINGFGQQSHLEMQPQTKPIVQITRKLVDLQVKGELEFVLQRGIPIDKIMSKEFNSSSRAQVINSKI